MISKSYNENIEHFTPSYLNSLNKEWRMFYFSYKWVKHVKESLKVKYSGVGDNKYRLRQHNYRVFVTSFYLNKYNLTIAIVIENIENKAFEIFNEYSDQIGKGEHYFHVRQRNGFLDQETFEIFQKFEFEHLNKIRKNKLQRLLE
ncbi:MAG: hypothetical protein WCP69_09590 [Bacteroidota bacterium]